jgi:hypothetical protein
MAVKLSSVSAVRIPVDGQKTVSDKMSRDRFVFVSKDILEDAINTVSADSKEE